MQLPAVLAAAVERELDGIPLADLQRAADRLSQRYRAELRDGRLHVSDELAAQAYLATRLPATYAAVRASLDHAAATMPHFKPRRQLDFGSGPGTACWAAIDCWSGLTETTLVEASESMRRIGAKMMRDAPTRPTWRAADITADGGRAEPPADLVTLAYVLDELSEAQRDRLVDRLWELTAGMLVIVEPGTPAGWRRILTARSRLIALGAHVAAPCPHAARCPIREPDWCHFAQRVARSRLHRQAKRGDVPYEDEKFAYVAVTRERPAARPSARVLSPPRAGSGKVALKLCQPDGTAAERLVTRREGTVFREARGLGWGDALGSMA